eukprot:TRINITY_DN4864_c0_g1_i1.p1 TRINITY_DN4864_c0_g1~~TRINITY_DN4864_c0_g1_i1.p1  ORF type:complete len:535 (+),score=158.40 TRINITY_DN4864_c0_g1_i1:88-1692(+)
MLRSSGDSIPTGSRSNSTSISSRIIMRHESAADTDLYDMMLEAERKKSRDKSSSDSLDITPKSSKEPSSPTSPARRPTQLQVPVKGLMEKLSAGTQLRKKARRALKKGDKEGYHLLDEAAENFKAIVQNYEYSHFALYNLARIYIDKTEQFADVAHKKEFDDNIASAIKYIEAAAKVKPSDPNTFCLWGMILLEKAKKVQNNGHFVESEFVLALSCEKILKCFELDSTHAVAYKLLLDCQELMTHWQKERSRQGLAVYHIAGELTKEGGSYKSWKTRWFVVDDTSICYYKEKEVWDRGPVIGAPIRPQGIISFADILDITRHEATSKCTNIVNRPKGLQPFCLHILTKTRTFNVLGFENEKDAQKWHDALKVGLRLYNVKKNVKGVLRDHRSSINVLSSDKLRKALELKLDKTKTEHEMLLGSPLETRDNKVDLLKSAKAYTKKESEFRVPQQRFFTYENLREKLEDMTEEDVSQLALKTLQDYAAEGTLAELILTLIQENPKDFLFNLANISDFQISKFGGFEKLKKLLNNGK